MFIKNKQSTRSLDQLVQEYRVAHDTKDINKILDLYYMEGVDQTTKDVLINYNTDDFAYKIKSLEITEPEKGPLLEYDYEGVHYKAALPVVKKFVVSFEEPVVKDNNSGTELTITYYIGIHNNSY